MSKPAHRNSPCVAVRPWLAALGCLLLLAPLAGVVQARDYSLESARSSPAWVRDGVIYEIYPRDFSAGGNLAGVTARLDALQSLGVNILWLMPIHPIGQLNKKGPIGSPYAVRDYYGINPDYGTAADLHQLVSAAHQRGMKVIIDIVANHTAWDSVLMQHPDFYKHDASAKIIPPQPDWADVAALNYANPQLRSYMITMLQSWLRDFDLDGFRCDAASLLPTSFWEQARPALEQIKPDILMLAEADDPGLLVKAFDVDYAWTMHATLEAVLQGRQPVSNLRTTWEKAAAAYPQGALRMRFTDNHDQRRAIARFGEPAALAGAALMFTLDGVPMLYNGMEVGDTGESASPALFDKIPVFWPTTQLRPSFLPTFQALIALRKGEPALRSGQVLWATNSAPERVLSFRRELGAQKLLVVLNLSSQPFHGRVAARGRYREITPAALRGEKQEAVASLQQLDLGAWQVRVFRAEN